MPDTRDKQSYRVSGNILPVSDKVMPVVVAALLMLIGFVAFRDYLFLQKIYFCKGLACDTYNIGYPVIYNNASYIAHHGLPQWSFSAGMGQSIFPFFLRDPFDIIFYIAGRDHIFFGAVLKEFLKIILIGLAAYKYLRTIERSPYVSLIGSLCIAYCGFAMVGSFWWIFTFEILNFMLLLLAFEQLFIRKKPLLFPFAIFLMAISQPFNLYIYGIFLLFYIVLRLFQSATGIKKSLALLGWLCVLSVIGIALAGPFLWENIVQIAESPRGSGLIAYTNKLKAAPAFQLADMMQLGTAALRLFSTDLLGTGITFNGWENYLEAPLFYCGLPCLLLMPQLFAFLKPRVRIAFIVILAIWMLPIIFPYFRRAFWLFSGDYCRAYSFFVGFLLLFYALHALEYIVREGKIKTVTLIVTLVALLNLLYYPYFPAGSKLYHSDYPMPDNTIRLLVTTMLLVYAVLIFAIGCTKKPRYLIYTFLAVLVFELSWQSHTTLNNMEQSDASDIAGKKGYNDYTIEAVNYLKSIDPTFYRIDKTYSSSPARYGTPNDAMVQGYRSTGSYNPFNQLHYILYLQLMGLINPESENTSRWPPGLMDRPILGAESQVKYYMTKTELHDFQKNTSDSIATFGDVKVFRNKFALPFGYTYKYYVHEQAFTSLPQLQKDIISLQACVLKQGEENGLPGLKEFPLADTIPMSSFDTAVYRNLTKALAADTLTVNSFSETSIKGYINLSQDKLVYLSVPFDDGWILTVDGHRQDKILVNAGMTGIMLPPGKHNIDLTFKLRYLKKGIFLSFAGALLYGVLWFFCTKRRKKQSPETSKA